jgi:hypothetical protein
LELWLEGLKSSISSLPLEILNPGVNKKVYYRRHPILDSKKLFSISIDIAVETTGRTCCGGQEISVRARPPTKVTSVSFGFRSMGNDKEYKEWDRDGKAYFHRSAAVLLSGHP